MLGAERGVHIHCARRESNAADPAKIPFEFLLFTHPGHVLVILAGAIVADGLDRGVHGLIFEILVNGRHRELADIRWPERNGSRQDRDITLERYAADWRYGPGMESISSFVLFFMAVIGFEMSGFQSTGPSAR